MVVKEYLLPIFESDGKKILKQKPIDIDQKVKESSTIKSELKLSEILLDNMNSIKVNLKLKEQENQDVVL